MEAPFKINKLSNDILQFMRDYGLTCLYYPDQQTCDRIEQLFGKIWNLFSKLNGRDGYTVEALFIYDREKCERHIGDAHTTMHKYRSAIGLDRSILDSDEDYLALLLLHELAHALGNLDHDDLYENFLNYLISIYNAAYDAHVTNDYDSYEGGN